MRRWYIFLTAGALCAVLLAAPADALSAETAGAVGTYTGCQRYTTSMSSPSPYAELDISRSDRELLAKLVYLEARGEPFDGQTAVAEVVLNRLLDGYWGDTVRDVIYFPSQFAAPSQGTPYGEEQYKAVLAALAGDGPLRGTGAIYFRARRYHSWAEPVMRIGGHYFSK